MRMSNRNRIAKFLPGALLVILAIAGAEAETAYLRKALGVEIGLSCADWRDIYMDMPESVGIDEQMALVQEHVSVVEVDGVYGVDGYMEVLDYEAAKSAGVHERAIELAERMTQLYNEVMDIALEGEARYAERYAGMSFFAVLDMKMSEYPRVQAYMSMFDGYESEACR